MPIVDCPIIGYYDQQRFKQFNPSDCANWYLNPSDLGKKKVAAYPVMGRQHIRYLNENRLIFDQEPRAIYKSIDFWYAIVGNRIFQIDEFYNQIEITSSVKLQTLTGNIFFTYLVASNNTTTPSGHGLTFACFADGQKLYIFREDNDAFGSVTDPNLPVNPLYLATFGNRINVSSANTATFGLSEVNLGGSSFDLNTCFTINGAAIFAQEAGIINQMGVLQNTLYIFCDYTTGVWSNIPSSFISSGGTVTQFPFKKNTTYDWDFGIADPNTLDIDFGMICFLSRNRSGLVQPMVSTGGKPEKMSTKAVDVKIQSIVNFEAMNPFLALNADGFLYEYEDTIFYRFGGGMYVGNQFVDQVYETFSFEFNFDTKTWHRCIELNGERCRNQDHVFFANKHLVTVEGDSTVYEMSGRFYTNDISNTTQSNRQAVDAYNIEPFRYERVTPIICSGLIDTLQKLGAAFYDDFITDWLEIDFVWGDSTFINTDAPFENAQFIIDEEVSPIDGTPQFMVSETNPNQYIIAEQGNFPVAGSQTYNSWFKPHIELLISDDGGVTFLSADVLEFSQLGVYQWRMRWYRLGTSRNRVYKLICVSPAPIIVLGSQMCVRRASGSAA